MTTLAPTKSLLDHIRAEEDILIGLKTQFVTLRAFEQELAKRVGTRKFFIANTVVWNAMLAKRDLFMIRFASWVRGMVEKGGFFRQVRSHHIVDLRNAWAAHPPFHRRLEDLFPAASARNQVDPSDVDALKDATWTKFQGIVQDRDSFRAHPYDGDAKADAKALRLSEVEPLLLHAEELMNTFRLVANRSTFAYNVSTPTHLGTATQDLVDLLLFHGIMQLMLHTGANEGLRPGTGSWWWQLRDAFLAELGRLGAGHPELAVNDRSLIERASEEVTKRAPAAP